MTTTTSTEAPEHARARPGWVKATAIATLVVLVTSTGFLVVPDLIAHRLAGTPLLRDLVVVVWVSVFFVAACLGLLRLQRRRSGSDRRRAGSGPGEGVEVVEIPDAG